GCDALSAAATEWEACQWASAVPRYFVVNGEGGAPGLITDCHLMEGDPQRVLEGLLIAAYSAGTNLGIIYINGAARFAFDRMAREGSGRAPSRRPHPRIGVLFPRGDPAGASRVSPRRGARAAGVDRGPASLAADETPASCGIEALGEADRDQQRRDSRGDSSSVRLEQCRTCGPELERDQALQCFGSSESSGDRGGGESRHAPRASL